MDDHDDVTAADTTLHQQYEQWMRDHADDNEEGDALDFADWLAGEPWAVTPAPAGG